MVLDDIKGALSRGQPVVFVMSAMPDFFAIRGDTPYVDTTRENTNFHAMALIGYDEDRQASRLVNSWGQYWGDHGYAWLGYATFKLMAGEAYALGDGAASAPQPAQSSQQRFDTLAAKMPCGAITVANADGHLTVSGFGGLEASIADLRAATLDVDPQARFAVALNGWPQYETQLTLAAPLATGSVSLVAQTEDGKPRSGDPVTMKAGDTFGLAAETSAARPYVSIVYLQRDGSAAELYRGVPAPDAQGRRAITIGLGGAAQVRFQVVPPYGDEIVVAIASAQPLFDAGTSEYATERQFLTGLRARLAGAPTGSVAAAVLRLRTQG